MIKIHEAYPTDCYCRAPPARVVTTSQSTVTSPPTTKRVGSSGVPLVWWLRAVVLLSTYALCSHAAHLQQAIDTLWTWLRLQPWYRTVYAETFFVQVWSFPAMLPYKCMDAVAWFRKYRIAGSVYYDYSPGEIMWEIFEYSLPLMLLDTFHVKHYAGVTDDVIEHKRLDWIQTTRALPEAPPLIGDMVRHLLIALVFYDLLFFLQHFSFHKNATLYRLFHKKHHTHDSLNVKVTNQLHVVERLALVLSANFGLKIQGAHPLTRSVFIMVFICVLVDNHSGYDLPWGYHRLLPRGIIAGPRVHFDHHEHGSRNYQPIFTYMDKLIEWWRRHRKAKS